MKPLYLKMSAFGSYAKETIIDFRKVEQGVFLITGDTGSGKTTIFDGITYALFGQTSGGRRDGSMMRSQYAPIGEKTFVELEFISRGQIYRVVRSPEYERESKRKNKDGEHFLTKEKASVELYLPDGQLFPGKQQDTNRKLVEILGVDYQQFAQLAMIAQGDFMKLLLAKSDERKEIFSRIFDTRFFWKIQEELKGRTKKLYGQLEDNRKSCLREMEQLEGAGEDWEEEKKSLLEIGQKEPDLVRTLQIAGELHEEDLQLYEKKQKESRKINQQSELLNQACSVAEKTEQQFVQLEKVLEEEKRLEALQPAAEQERIRLEQAEAAGKVVPFRQIWLQMQEERGKTEKRLQNLEIWLSHREEEMKTFREQADQYKEYLKKLEEQEIPRLHQLRQNLERYQGLQVHLDQAQSLERDLEKRINAYQQAQQHYQKQAEAYENLYQAYFREQAGILAAALAEGDPCPVCGSTTHPRKAVLSEQAPSQKQVEEAKRLRDHSEQERERCQTAVLERKGKLEGEMAVIREHQQQLLGKEMPSENLRDLRELWNGWEKKAKKRLQEGMERVETVQKKSAQAEEELKKAAAEIHQRKGQMEENRELLLHQKEQETQAAEQYRKLLEAQGFAEETQLLSRVLEEKEILNRRKKLETYRMQQMECVQKRKVLEEQTKDMQRPELEKIKEELDLLRDRKKSLEKELQKLYSRRERNKIALRKLESLSAERELLRKQYEIVANLSRTVNGNLSGTAKIDLESYIQRQYFEQMIRCANQHLSRMASGQFLLRCRSLEHLSTQGNAGLDLDVYSLITGKERDVKTLSGGESFMAALALALGMTDVITRTTGAVRMETLFIDEGFGSLDDTAREQAIRILQGLAGGTRLVGIISHVTELKEQMEQKLIVTKTPQGSRAVWG